MSGFHRLLLIFFLAIPVVSFAQPKKKKTRILRSWAFQMSGEGTFLHRVSDDYILKNYGGVGSKVGVSLFFQPIKWHVGFEVGVAGEFTTCKTKQDPLVTMDFDERVVQSKMFYVNVPFHLTYAQTFAGKGTFIFTAGPEASYFLKDHSKLNILASGDRTDEEGWGMLAPHIDPRVGASFMWRHIKNGFFVRTYLSGSFLRHRDNSDLDLGKGRWFKLGIGVGYLI